MLFEFATASRILFGPGRVQEVVPAARMLGKHVLLVTGRTSQRAAGLLRTMNEADLVATVFTTEGEPTLDLVRQGTALAVREGCDVVVAFGGGSAIDAGKGIAALLRNGGEPLDFLEVIGHGKPLGPSAPLIAVPTTAGTGSEVTRNAVLASPEHGVKASLRSAGMLPRLAVVDPELTTELPKSVAATTGLDALTQLIEPYVSVRANPMTDAFCVEGMPRAAAALRKMAVGEIDAATRADMSLASMLSGLALANAGLGAVHGFAAPIGGCFPIPHGAICAALLPHATAMNLTALRARDKEGRALARYEMAARLVTGKPHATPDELVDWLSQTVQQLGISCLGQYGVRKEDIDDLVAKAAKASSMKGNPIVLTPEEMHRILAGAL